MLFGRSQLLLAGIPTGAALIGLLWLKRRRSNLSLHHTDPGGSSPEQQQIIIKKQGQLEDTQQELQLDFELEAEQEVVKSIELDLVECIAENFIESNNKDIIDLSDNLVEEVERISELQDNIEVVTLSASSVEGTVDLSESTDKEEVTVHQVTNEVPESEELKKEEEQTTVVLESEVTVENSTNIETSAEKIVDSSVVVVEKKTIEEDKEDKVEIEEKIEVSKEVEEGAIGGTTTMKTAPTQQLVEKLACLELDTMKIGDESSETEQKGSSERDSANHSPSEVMLASPSISNFSDAHSEGSSDSGKGHSDVATPPSRTPAGGSSLAGDHAPSIYEFILPQFIVGRLIGRRGTFLHEIRSSTSTNIYIKRHPDTEKLKICAIEGSQQDINKALAKIRQKFPLRRFPELTLEKVSFVTINPLPPLKLEDFRLQLVEGVNNDVILSSLITAAHFFLQQPSHPSYCSLGALNHVMNQVYSSAEAPGLESPVKDAVCAAPTMGGWYRAQIVGIDEEAGNSTVRFLDYGGYLTLDSNLLKQIRGDLLTLPFQAVECYLANVAPIEQDTWSEEARVFVHNATIGQVLQAQIYDYAEDGTPLVYLYASYGSQVILINEELVMRGLGVLTTSTPPAPEE